MDQAKIGKFIAGMRKKKNLTQRELADKLMLSDKTISKWECGKGLPEVSLMLPLCDILDISVNELLSGEAIIDKNYKMKAEENMVHFMKEREDNKEKMILIIILGILSISVFLVLLLIVCFYTKVIPLPIKLLIILFACLVFAVGLYFTLSLERKTGYYECRCCHETFVPKWKDYIFSLHLISSRRLKCPKCNKKSFCKKKLMP